MARWAVAALTVVLIGLGLGLYGWARSPLGSPPQPVAVQLPSNPAGVEAVTNPIPVPPAKKAESGTTEPAPAVAKLEPTPVRPAKPSPLPMKSAPEPVVLPVTETPASKAEIAKNWPRFRGPGGTGISAYDNIPTAWNVQKGENIVWKTPVPLEGNSSPVVWKDHLFLTGATSDKRQVFCFSTLDGKLLWQKDAPGTPASTAEPPKVNDDTGFASPTPATDGHRIYASFANGDLVAFDFTGALVWARSLGMPKNSYGHAASLATWGKFVIVQFDQATVKEKLSKIMALDGETGKTVWETPRSAPNSWSTPIVIEVKGQDQLVTCGDPWAIAYIPADGKEIWRAKCLRQDVGPSPTFADGIVYIANQSPNVSALRPDHTGELKPIWLGEDGLPDTSSPLATPQYVLLMTSEGTLTCYDAKEGKKLWEQDFEDTRYKSSPGMAGKYLYLFADAGKYFVVLPGPEGCKTISQGTLAEDCSASPAFLDGRIYIRGKHTLFCIGKK
jgi:outer membrane protein assembly factor BamB